jgi:hypothetical protein
LRGPFLSVAVPDQRCTAPLRFALHRVRDTNAATTAALIPSVLGANVRPTRR